MNKLKVAVIFIILGGLYSGYYFGIMITSFQSMTMVSWLTLFLSLSSLALNSFNIFSGAVTND